MIQLSKEHDIYPAFKAGHVLALNFMLKFTKFQ